MADNYKDLDALVPADLTVRLGGVDYSLPGDLPLEIFVKVNKASELEEEDEARALDEMVDALADLFAHYSKGKPEHDAVRERASATLRQRGIKFNTQLLRELYKEDEQVDEEGNGKS